MKKKKFFFLILGSCGETTSLVTNQMNFDELCRTIDEQSEFITLFCKFYLTQKKIFSGFFFLIK